MGGNIGRRCKRAAFIAMLAVFAALLLAGCENKNDPDASTQWQPMGGSEQDARQTPKPTRPKEPRRTEIPHG